MLYVYICSFLCLLHAVLSGTIPMAGLTNTKNPDSVQPFIDKNIHKIGYEKAVKEFLDEKRKEIQKKTAPFANSLKMTLRSHERVHDPLLSVEVTTEVSTKSSERPTSRLSSSTRRIQNRPRNMIPGSKRNTRLPADLKSNAHNKMMLRSHSRLHNPSTSVEATTATSDKSNKKPKFQLPLDGVRRSARIAAK